MQQLIMRMGTVAQTKHMTMLGRVAVKSCAKWCTLLCSINKIVIKSMHSLEMKF